MTRLLVPLLGIPPAIAAGRWYDRTITRAKKEGSPGGVERVRWQAVWTIWPPLWVLGLLAQCQIGSPAGVETSPPPTDQAVERSDP